MLRMIKEKKIVPLTYLKDGNTTETTLAIVPTVIESPRIIVGTI